jgi:hypothetical protein
LFLADRLRPQHCARWQLRDARRHPLASRETPPQ